MTTRQTRRPGSGRSAAPRALAAVLLLALAAGCSSSDSGADDEIEGVATGSADEGGGGEQADHEAALTELYTGYWDALVGLENSGELDASLFEGIAASRVAEQELTRVRSYADAGLHRSGEPTVENVTVTVDGETARVESCVSEEDWPMVDGETVLPDVIPEELRAPHPHGVTATLTEGSWLIDGTLPAEEATLSCP
ncbi:hypothetical protein FH609_019410 [Streptomyces sp. 3MP-14]|uniref:Nuclear transport factor 2 family protein n=1 Tax=Streptomyces mimosae TaxID=2586635 RepID=A0A5N6A587_9ACTN|nr:MULTISPECIES: hypothetical protein [Streptomyces]KAB8163821.1 hypothetical protein FH607_017950 [Streptomyces mimosae]KAB8175264.1 hypothetical protein FH609_019410 [Streptomyces sp. 3MP-14]